MSYTAEIKKLERHYLPADFKVKDWPALEPYFVELVERPINSVTELEQWLKDTSELEAML